MKEIYLVTEDSADESDGIGIIIGIFKDAGHALEAASKHRLSEAFDGGEICVIEYCDTGNHELKPKGENLFTLDLILACLESRES